MMKKLILFCAALLSATCAYAQGGPVLSSGIIVLGSTGRPVAGATVTFCSSSATGVPCSPTVSVFADAALTIPANNPQTTDGNGNVTVYAPLALYKYTVTGQGVSLAGQPYTAVAAGASGGGGGVAAPVTSLQYNNMGVQAGAAGITTPDGDSLQIKGPNPWVDVNSFGARPVGAVPSTTASCVGTTAITLAADPGFVNGDGIVIYGCGATNTLSTPGVPTATTGIASTLTVPDAKLVAPSAAGASTYQYKIFGIDKHGGTTVAGAAVTLGTGPAALGMSGPIAVTSASLSGTTLTLTLPAPNSLAAGMLIHFSKSNNALLSGYYSISSVGGGGTSIVIINTEIESTGTAITSTGGNIAFATGNQLTWTPVANTWEYGICAKRPGDGAYSLIGLALPSLTRSYTSNTTFTDWGATLTSAPMLPAYLTSANCAAGAATNDYLSTTIVSGAGTTSIVVANAASQTAATQTAKFDDAPGFLAAAQSVSAIAGGIVFIPPDPNGGSYYINSRLDLVSLGPGLSVNQEGLVFAYETIAFRAHWYGTQSALSVNQFQAASAPVIGCNGAWPCFYDPDEVPFVDHLTFGVPNSNSSLVMLFDGQAGPLQGGTLSRITCSSGTTLDYSGMCIVVRPGPYNFIMQDMSTLSGPSNLTTSIDSTWTPSIYFVGDATASPFSAINYHLRDIQMSGRTMYMATVPGTTGQNDEIAHLYAQGPIIPMVTLQNPTTSVPGINMRITDWTTDTSPVSSIVVLGPLAVVLDAMDIGVPSAEAGGIPGWVSGRNLFGGSFSSTPPLTAGAYVGISGVDLTGTYASNYRCPEQAAPSGIAGFDLFWCDSTAHRFKINPNNAGAQGIPSYTVSPVDLDCLAWSGTIGLFANPGGKCARYTITPTANDCANWSGTGGLLGDPGGACVTTTIVPVAGHCAVWATTTTLGDSGVVGCPGGAGGMNTDGSNMASPMQMSQTLAPATVNTIAVGTAAKPFTNIFLGTVANQAVSVDTSSITANRSLKATNGGSMVIPQSIVSVSHQFLTALNATTGVFSQVQPALGDISGVTFSGPTTELATVSGAVTGGHAAVWDASFNLVDGGTTVTSSSANTFTTKIIDQEGTGNVITTVSPIWASVAGCNNASAGPTINLATTQAPTPNCLTGSNVLTSTLDFDDSTNEFGQFSFRLPHTWVGNIDIDFVWLVTASGGSNAVKWTVATACSATGSSYDTAYNSAQTITTNVGANNIQTVSTQNTVTVTGCGVDNLMNFKLGRDTTDTFTGTARLLGVSVTLRHTGK